MLVCDNNLQQKRDIFPVKYVAIKNVYNDIATILCVQYLFVNIVAQLTFG